MFDVIKTTQALSVIAATLIIIPSMAMAQQSNRVAKPVDLDQVDTAELITALQQRDIVVPGHSTPAWPEIRNFTVRMESRKYTGSEIAIGDGDLSSQPTNTVFHSSETNCRLDTPCRIHIPLPSGARNKEAGSITFLSRTSLRQQLINDRKYPVGLDALRGDAIGLSFEDNKWLTSSLTGRSASVNVQQFTNQTKNKLNPKLISIRGYPESRDNAHIFALSYSRFKKHGLILDRPYDRGGRVTLTVVTGDPASGAFQYALGALADPAIADELSDRGINVDVNNTQAPPNGHRTTPSRFIGLLTLQGQATQTKTGRVLRSDPFVLDRPFGCDLTNQACSIQFSPAGIGAQYFFAFYPPSAAEISNPSNSVSGLLGFDRHSAYKQYEGWAAFDKSHGLNAASRNKDHQKGELYRVSDLMERGFENQESYPDDEDYKDNTWRFGFQIINIIQ